jgi:hypothetical protein
MYTTVKAPNLPPHGTFPYFLWRSVACKGEFSHKNEYNKFCKSKLFLKLSLSLLFCRTRSDVSKVVSRKREGFHDVESWRLLRYLSTTILTYFGHKLPRKAFNKTTHLGIVRRKYFLGDTVLACQRGRTCCERRLQARRRSGWVRHACYHKQRCI